MRSRLTLKPGQRGTKKLLARYGAQLFCVRYRYDEQKRRRYTTVELIVEEWEWQPAEPRPPAPDALIDIHAAWGDLELSRRVKGAGGRWNRTRGVWEIRYDQAAEAGLLAYASPGAPAKGPRGKTSNKR